MRVLVCGGRDFEDKELLYTTLDELQSQTPISCIIHGKARGADSLAGDWATERGITVEMFPANWHQYGKAAGAIRNQEMLDIGKPEYVVAFPGGRGTNDMVKRSKKVLGMQILEVHYNNLSSHTSFL